jgi:hypothetical protein
MAHTGPALLLVSALVALVVFAFWVHRQGLKKADSKHQDSPLLAAGQNHPATPRHHYALTDFMEVTPEKAAILDAYRKLTTPAGPTANIAPVEPENDASEVAQNKVQEAVEISAPASDPQALPVAAEAPVAEVGAAAEPAAAPAPEAARMSEEERLIRAHSRNLMDNPYDSAAPAFEAQQQTQRQQLQQQRKELLSNVVLKEGQLPNEVVPVHKLPVATPTGRRRPRLEEVED